MLQVGYAASEEADKGEGCNYDRYNYYGYSC
jgi:hypothetical protein